MRRFEVGVNLPLPTFLQATRRKYRGYDDPDLESPHFQEQLSLKESDRDPAILTILVKKSFKDPRP